MLETSYVHYFANMLLTFFGFVRQGNDKIVLDIVGNNSTIAVKLLVLYTGVSKSPNGLKCERVLKSEFRQDCINLTTFLKKLIGRMP